MHSALHPLSPPSLINFNALNKQYSPGDTVSGTVSFYISKKIKARFARISWQGKAKTLFPLGSDARLVDGSCTNILFEDQFYPWKSEDGLNELAPGSYKFPFSFIISNDIPPSFSGNCGYIRYSVKLEINRVTLQDLRFEEHFFVKTQTDSAFLENLEPIEMKAGGIARGLIMQKGLVEIEIASAQKVFQPGQHAELQLLLKNHSSANINQLSVALFEQVHYHSRPHVVPCKKFSRKYCQGANYQQMNEQNVIGDHHMLNFHVAKHSIGEYKAFINIPDSITPSFESPLITVGHFLRFMVHTYGFGHSPITFKLDVPIVNIHDEENKSEDVPISVPTCPPDYACKLPPNQE